MMKEKKVLTKNTKILKVTMALLLLCAVVAFSFIGSIGLGGQIDSALKNTGENTGGNGLNTAATGIVRMDSPNKLSTNNQGQHSYPNKYYSITSPGDAVALPGATLNYRNPDRTFGISGGSSTVGAWSNRIADQNDFLKISNVESGGDANHHYGTYANFVLPEYMLQEIQEGAINIEFGFTYRTAAAIWDVKTGINKYAYYSDAREGYFAGVECYDNEQTLLANNSYFNAPSGGSPFSNFISGKAITERLGPSSFPTDEDKYTTNGNTRYNPVWKEFANQNITITPTSRFIRLFLAIDPFISGSLQSRAATSNINSEFTNFTIKVADKNNSSAIVSNVGYTNGSSEQTIAKSKFITADIHDMNGVDVSALSVATSANDSSKHRIVSVTRKSAYDVTVVLEVFVNLKINYFNVKASDTGGLLFGTIKDGFDVKNIDDRPLILRDFKISGAEDIEGKLCVKTRQVSATLSWQYEANPNRGYDDLYMMLSTSENAPSDADFFVSSNKRVNLAGTTNQANVQGETVLSLTAVSDGQFYVYYGAKDQYGNLTSINRVLLIVDGKSPVYTADTKGHDGSSWYADKDGLGINLTLTDGVNFSGVEFYYKDFGIDGTDTSGAEYFVGKKTYGDTSSTITFVMPDQTNTYIKLYTKSGSGNVYTDDSLRRIRIDGSNASDIKFQVNNADFANNPAAWTTVFSSTASFSLSVNDMIASVVDPVNYTVTYRVLDHKGAFVKDGDVLTISGKTTSEQFDANKINLDRYTYIEFTFTANIANGASSKKVYTIKNDPIAPIVEFKMQHNPGTGYEDYLGGVWTTSAVRVSGQVVNLEELGNRSLKLIENAVEITTGANFDNYGTFTYDVISANSNKKYLVRATNNSNESTETLMMVDNLAISFDLNAEAGGKSLASGNWTNKDVRLFLDANTLSSNISGLMFTYKLGDVNQGEFATAGVTFSNNASQEVVVTATSGAGAELSKSFDLRIDKIEHNFSVNWGLHPVKNVIYINNGIISFNYSSYTSTAGVAPVSFKFIIDGTQYSFDSDADGVLMKNIGDLNKKATIKVFSIDAAGNIKYASTDEKAIAIDKTDYVINFAYNNAKGSILIDGNPVVNGLHSAKLGQEISFNAQAILGEMGKEYYRFINMTIGNNPAQTIAGGSLFMDYGTRSYNVAALFKTVVSVDNVVNTYQFKVSFETGSAITPLGYALKILGDQSPSITASDIQIIFSDIEGNTYNESNTNFKTGHYTFSIAIKDTNSDFVGNYLGVLILAHSKTADIKLIDAVVTYDGTNFYQEFFGSNLSNFATYFSARGYDQNGIEMDGGSEKDIIADIKTQLANAASAYSMTDQNGIATTDAKNAGAYSISLNGKAPYQFSIKLSFNIDKRALQIDKVANKKAEKQFDNKVNVLANLDNIKEYVSISNFANGETPADIKNVISVATLNNFVFNSSDVNTDGATLSNILFKTDGNFIRDNYTVENKTIKFDGGITARLISITSTANIYTDEYNNTKAVSHAEFSIAGKYFTLGNILASQNVELVYDGLEFDSANAGDRNIIIKNPRIKIVNGYESANYIVDSIASEGVSTALIAGKINKKELSNVVFVGNAYKEYDGLMPTKLGFRVTGLLPAHLVDADLNNCPDILDGKFKVKRDDGGLNTTDAGLYNLLYDNDLSLGANDSLANYMFDKTYSFKYSINAKTVWISFDANANQREYNGQEPRAEYDYVSPSNKTVVSGEDVYRFSVNDSTGNGYTMVGGYSIRFAFNLNNNTNYSTNGHSIKVAQNNVLGGNAANYTINYKSDGKFFITQKNVYIAPKTNAITYDGSTKDTIKLGGLGYEVYYNDAHTIAMPDQDIATVKTLFDNLFIAIGTEINGLPVYAVNVGEYYWMVGKNDKAMNYKPNFIKNGSNIIANITPVNYTLALSVNESTRVYDTLKLINSKVAFNLFDGETRIDNVPGAPFFFTTYVANYYKTLQTGEFGDAGEYKIAITNGLSMAGYNTDNYVFTNVVNGYLQVDNKDFIYTVTPANVRFAFADYSNRKYEELSLSEFESMINLNLLDYNGVNFNKYFSIVNPDNSKAKIDTANRVTDTFTGSIKLIYKGSNAVNNVVGLLDAGDYVLAGTNVSLGTNYNLTFNDYNFTIGKKAITVKGGVVRKVFDGAQPTYGTLSVKDTSGKDFSWPQNRRAVNFTQEIANQSINVGDYTVNVGMVIEIADLANNYNIQTEFGRSSITKRPVYLQFRLIANDSVLSNAAIEYSSVFDVNTAYKVVAIAANESEKTGFIGGEVLTSNGVSVQRIGTILTLNGGKTGYEYLLSYSGKPADDAKFTNYQLSYEKNGTIENNKATMARKAITLSLNGVVPKGSANVNVVEVGWEGLVFDSILEKAKVIRLQNGKIPYSLAKDIEYLEMAEYTDKILFNTANIVADSAYYQVSVASLLSVGKARLTIEMSLSGIYGSITTGQLIKNITFRNMVTNEIVEITIPAYSIALANRYNAGKHTVTVIFEQTDNVGYEISQIELTKNVALTVAKKDVKIIASDILTKQYKTQDPSSILNFNLFNQDDGFVYDDSVSATYTRTAGEAVGQYLAKVVSSSDNYNLISVGTDGNAKQLAFTVTKREITLAFSATTLAEKEYLTKASDLRPLLIAAINYNALGFTAELLEELKSQLVFWYNGLNVQENQVLNKNSYNISIKGNDKGNFIITSTSQINQNIIAKTINENIEVIAGNSSPSLIYGVAWGTAVNTTGGGYNLYGDTRAISSEVSGYIQAGLRFVDNKNKVYKEQEIKDAGEYEVTIVDANGNFIFNNVTTYNITIAKRSISVGFKDVAADGAYTFKYDAKQHAAIPDFKNESNIIHEVVYSKQGENNFSPEKPQKAGVYDVEIRMDSNNYNIQQGSGATTMTITAIKVTTPTFKEASPQYNGEKKNIIIVFAGAVPVGYTVVYKQNGVVVQNPTIVGAYDVIIEITDENYVDDNNESALGKIYETTLNIQKGNIETVLKGRYDLQNIGDSNIWGFTGAPSDIVTISDAAEVAKHNLSITVYDGVNAIDSISNAGTYNLRMEISSPYFALPMVRTATYTINPVIVDAAFMASADQISFDNTAGYVFSYENKDYKANALITSNNVDGQPIAQSKILYKYSKIKGSTYEDVPSVRDAGVYICTISLSDSNYKINEASKSIKMTVLPIKLDIVVTLADKMVYEDEAGNKIIAIYNGEAQKPIIEVKRNGVTASVPAIITFKDSTGAIVKEMKEQGVYTISVTTEGGNYDADEVWTMTIKKPVISPIDLDAEAYSYDGLAKVISLPKSAIPGFSGTKPSDYYEPIIKTTYKNLGTGVVSEEAPSAVGEYIVEFELNVYGYEIYNTATTLRIFKGQVPLEYERAETGDSITIAPIPGAKYRINGGEWQTNNVFSGLDKNADYMLELMVEGEEKGNYAISTAKILATSDIEKLDWNQIFMFGGIILGVGGLVMFIILITKSKPKKKKKKKYEDDDDDEDDEPSKQELKRQSKEEAKLHKDLANTEGETAQGEPTKKEAKFTKEMEEYFGGEEE